LTAAPPPGGFVRPNPVRDPGHRQPDTQEAAQISAFGLKLFLAGLSFLFAATIGGYLFVMLGGSATEWNPGVSPTYTEAVSGRAPDTRAREAQAAQDVATEGAAAVDPTEAGILNTAAPAPAVPRLSGRVWGGLGGATVLMLASSFTIALSYRALRRGNRSVFLRYLYATAALGAIFLIAQYLNWLQLADELPLEEGGLRSSTFYILTGTHALHVVGGLVPLGIVLARSNTGRYGASDWIGVRNVAWYWHFLDVVWVLMLLTMLAVGH